VLLVLVTVFLVLKPINVLLVLLIIPVMVLNVMQLKLQIVVETENGITLLLPN